MPELELDTVMERDDEYEEEDDDEEEEESSACTNGIAKVKVRS